MTKPLHTIEDWPITLEKHPPSVLDNSVIETYARCPRKGLYKYGLRRGGLGVNFPIAFGIAYHKYREASEDLMRNADSSMSDDIHREATIAALENFVEAPHGHKHEHLSRVRLLRSLDMARARVEREQAEGKVIVTRTEDSFDLELPFRVCDECSYGFWFGEKGDDFAGEEACPRCGCTRISQSRHGGRMDQIIEWNSKQWVRDFKTTGMMGKTYPLRFQPNNQMTGYVWAGTELSGRAFEGTLIEVLYNTKRQGPETHQFISTRSIGQIEQWIGSMFMEHRFISMMWGEAERLGYLAFPQRTQACNDYGGCNFRDACSQDSAWAIEEWLRNNTQYSEWDFTDPDKEVAKK